MAGKVLGLQTGSTAAADLDAQPKLLIDKIKDQTPILYDTFPSAFIDLNAGRIQGILMDEVYANYYLKHLSNSGSYRTLISSPSQLIVLRSGCGKVIRRLKRRLMKD